MRVFLTFDGNVDAVPFLEEALNGWEKVRFAVPEVIELKPGEKFEIQRRVIADGLAKEDHYILADIDAKPEEPWVVSQINKTLHGRDKVGLAFLRPLFDIGGRVRVIRRGIVQKWPQAETDNYDLEHGQAVIRAGFTMETWDDIWYRHLPKEHPLLIN